MRWGHFGDIDEGKIHDKPVRKAYHQSAKVQDAQAGRHDLYRHPDDQEDHPDHHAVAAAEEPAEHTSHQ